MKWIWRELRPILYGTYLGGMLGVLFKVSILDWRWWTILVPTIMLVEIFHKEKIK